MIHNPLFFCKAEGEIGVPSIVYQGERIEYSIERKKVKHLNLRITADGTVRISAPWRVSNAFIQAFAEEKASWIWQRLKQREHAFSSPKAQPEAKEGAALWLQFAVFLVVSILALIATRPLARKMLDKTIVPTNADRVLHHEAKVTETVDNENATGAVYIDGKTWTARSEDGNIIPKGKMARIVRMEGVKLYVRESKEPSERRE